MMPEVKLKIATCESCGADIREDTLFCYSCGRKYADAANVSNGSEQVEISDEAKTALDDLAEKFKLGDAESQDKMALAAAERKKARVTPRKAKEMVWETDESISGTGFFVASLFISILVVAVVFLTVYWK